MHGPVDISMVTGERQQGVSRASAAQPRDGVSAGHQPMGCDLHAHADVVWSGDESVDELQRVLLRRSPWRAEQLDERAQRAAAVACAAASAEARSGEVGDGGAHAIVADG